MENNQQADIRQQLLENAVAAATSRALANNSHDPSRRRMQPGGFPYGNHNFYQYYWYDGYPFPPEDKFIGIIPWALRILKLFAVGFMLLSSSIAMYALFYWAVMPGNYASRPLFFDYTGTVVYPHMEAVVVDENHNSDDSALVESGTKKWWKKWKKDKGTEIALSTSSSAFSSSSSESESSCAFTPWATIDLFSEEQAVTLGETMNSELIPPPTISDRVLQPQQRYYVEVHLRLPESELNRQLGMFGVAVELLSYSSANDTSTFLASSVRPARLPHESNWIGVARKLLWLLPLIFGGMEESRTVVVPSFRHIVESKDHPLRHIVVRLVGQPLGWNGQSFTREQGLKFPVEVIGGEVRIGKELNEFQQMLKDWFYTCYAIGTLILFGMHVMVYILVDYYRRDSLDDFGGSYVDPFYDFDDNADEENDEFESIISEDHPRHGGGGNDDDSDNEDNNDAGNQFRDAAPNVDRHSGFSDPGARGGHRDTEGFYGDDADDPDDWEDLTSTPSPQANQRHNSRGQEEEEITDVAPNDSPQVVSLLRSREYSSISSLADADRVHPQQPTSTGREKLSSLSLASRQNQGISETTNQFDKLDTKQPPSSFTIGTVKYSPDKSASKTKQTLSKNDTTYDKSSSDFLKGPARTEVAIENFFDCAQDTADFRNERENRSNEELLEPSCLAETPFQSASRDSQLHMPGDANYFVSAEDFTFDIGAGMTSPRSIAFPSATTRIQNAKAFEEGDHSLAKGLSVNSTVMDHPGSGSNMSIDRKAAIPLTLPDPVEIQQDALLFETPMVQTRESLFDEDDSVTSNGSWESLSIATEKARTTNMKWVSIDSDEISSSVDIEKAPLSLPRASSPIGGQIAYRTSSSDGYKGPFVHHETEHNLFHEMSQFHEAQTIDSFLQDLINPFVR